MIVDENKYKWASVIECHFCKKITLMKECCITAIDYEYFGAKGSMYVKVCKECDRDKKLNELEI